MENCMTDNQIIDFIKNYIDKTSYNYAILIDGSWGSGKTYFIENKLIPSIKENQKSKISSNKEYKEKKVIYISLYGITSRGELIKQIFMETMPFSDLLKSKKFGVVSGFSKTILAGALSYTGITLPDKIIDNSDFISLENCILIFDDLERCDMNVNEVLGYINNFVEHDGIKVIIAANEKELATPRNNLNKELKYLIASKENIAFPKGSEKKRDILTYSNEPQPNGSYIKIDELDRRINLLFGEDELYKLIKEKLIGVTIYYKPEITSIINELVNKNIMNEKVKEIILSVSNKEFIKGSFDFYEHHNIRTLLFGIDKFESLIADLKEDIDIISYRKVFDEIFKYFVAVSIIYKSGKALYDWKDDEEIDVIPLTDSSNMRDYIKGFKFVDYYISMTTFNKEKVVEIIKRESEILKTETSLDNSNPLYKLNIEWLIMSDAEVEEMIKNVILQLEKDPNNYSPVNYSSILYYTIILYRIGVSNIDIKKVIEIMKNNLKSLKIESNFNTFGYAPIFNEKQDELIYSEAIEVLNNKLKQDHEDINELKLKDILKNVNEWTNKLSEYVCRNSNEILSQKSFLSNFQYEELIEAIKSSSNEQINTFKHIIIQNVYSFSNINEYYQSDKDIIEKIINELEVYLDEIKDKHKIRTVNFQFLINDLKYIYQKLS